MIGQISFALFLALGASAQVGSGGTNTLPDQTLPEGPRPHQSSSKTLDSGSGKFRDAKPPELPRELVASTVTPIQVPVFSSDGNPSCDSDGNLFFHLSAGNYGTSPVLRISPDGQKSTLFKAADNDETKPAFITYNVTPLGVVRELAEATDGNVVLEFDSNGKVSSRTKLAMPEHVSGQDFAAFENGTILFYGYFNKNADDKLRGQRYVALFAPSGQLLKRIQDKEQLDLAVFNTTFQNGAVTLGKDGYIYLARQSEVVVISLSGKIVRRMPFEKNPHDAAVTKISYSDGLLALVLSSSGEQYINNRYVIMDSSTGEQRGYYAPSRETSNIDVCFSRKEGFTFIHNIDGKLALINAPLR
jgi:hypothetical protein